VQHTPKKKGGKKCMNLCAELFVLTQNKGEEKGGGGGRGGKKGEIILSTMLSSQIAGKRGEEGKEGEGLHDHSSLTLIMISMV